MFFRESFPFFYQLLGLKKHKQCIHIVSINVPSDDPAQASNNYAFQANDQEASLGKNPGLFQIKHGGFLGIKETVAIESAKKPGYYLRHKNYKFHLQKASNSSIFGKTEYFENAFLYKVLNNLNFFNVWIGNETNPFMKAVTVVLTSIILCDV